MKIVLRLAATMIAGFSPRQVLPSMLDTQAEIANRVKAWVFDYASQESREESRDLKAAAAFLEKNRDLFPPVSLPSYPVQLAALAVKFIGSSPK